jgi:hypothetical protein
VFLSNGSVTRRLASLHWLQLGAVRQLRRYYQDAMTSCRPSRRTSFPSLGGTSLALALFAPRRTSAPSGPGVGHPVSPAGIIRGNDRISQVPGEPQLSVCTCSATPAGLLTPDHSGAAAWPLVFQKQRLPRKVFRRSIAWLSDSLSTHHQGRYLPRRKTRFRPLVRRYRTGFPPARFLRKVSKLFPYISSSSFPKLLGTMKSTLRLSDNETQFGALELENP